MHTQSTVSAPSLSERQDALIAKANEWNRARKVRAIEQIDNYRLLAGGALLNESTRAIYHPQRVIERPAGTQYIGCDCEDFKGHVTRLREQMAAASCSAPISCKHSALRVLLSGQPLRIDNSVFRARRAAK